MSETDSFIEEVSEEVRRDKLFALFRRYGWIGIAGIVGIVGAAAFLEWQRARNDAEARAFGDAVLGAVSAEADPGAALEALAATGARDGIRKLLLAADRIEAGDRTAARALLEAVADDPAQPESLRQLARLKAVIVAGPDLAPAERDAALAGLAQAGAPYRLLALEQQALALVEAERPDAAITLAREILASADVTPDLRRRAAELIVALGGEADAS